MSHEKLNVIIADDHPIIRLGMRELIDSNERLILVGEAACSQGLIELLEQQAADIIITDYNMPISSNVGNGLQLIEYIRRKYSHPEILVLTMISNQLIISRLYELGVTRVIHKSQSQSAIALTLSSIVSKLIYGTQKKKASKADPAKLEERFASLSPMELDIVRLFVSGLTVADIARSQSRSPKTISTHKSSAMKKLNIDCDQVLLEYYVRYDVFRQKC
ncbi:response regulator [Pseudomonas chlororaphis]|uniref:response regulator n=1 Tax=Pseudomonas chlororaphis TaxID=587753 RepID=UPI0006A601B3|nr:response regulator [Pseudomonas chlororaphis]